jgi:phosphomevalonate kinase
VPEGFEALEAAAEAEDAAFCVSGAGGGDVATYVGHASPSASFAARAARAGLFEIDVDLDEKGVRAVMQPAASSVAAVQATSSS